MGGWGTGQLTGREFRKAPTPVRTVLYLALPCVRQPFLPKPLAPHILAAPISQMGKTDFRGKGTGLAVLARTKAAHAMAGSGKAVSRAHVSDHRTITPLMGGWVPWRQGASAFHAIAVKVTQQQAQVKVHGATSGCVQAIAVGPTVDGIPMQQLRPTTHEGPCQLLLPAAQGPPGGTVQLVGSRTAGHVTKAVTCKLAAAEAILGPHLEMEPGPACKTGERGVVQPVTLWLSPLPWCLPGLLSGLPLPHNSQWLFLNPYSSPAQNPSMAPQCLQNKI